MVGGRTRDGWAKNLYTAQYHSIGLEYSLHQSHQSNTGPRLTRLNLKSPCPASSSVFKNLLTPLSNAFSLNMSSSSANSPRHSGPFLLPSSSYSRPSLPLTKHTKCKSTFSSALGALVSPFFAASACALSRAELEYSKSALS
ncbi:hypothetical protein H113_03676 [Trichophyton rubrum MR1459]|uniref:Uncharacterized protein n=1 Tax=Trichophyton rubrum (strain ATCC MYA-4607 / CBS 118892) TaxID=559305 RepID=A0A080WNI1_TRIRC|nr:uncharacterized protein TERG_12220 [Trichophyton rubrum CBS 118892]EZF96038.1 hypothetical protein H113_03676 [Trichophyton rubrum MR1459]EZG07052.1 hypothetical protein H106_03465 [Trichophyton rubrum CBS 735.88]KFL61795.1 hypothetical protein TERG_12220 [Trichophyton rubrum CBS 118892]